MKVFELLEFNRESIKIMRRAGVKLNDVDYIGLYSEYNQMVKDGEKVTYVAARMAEKYGVSVRQVYVLVKRLGKDCKMDAVRI